MRVIKDAVSRADLRAMAVGQTLEFVLPTPNKLESARTACNTLKIYRMKFSTKINREQSSITIERLT